MSEEQEIQEEKVELTPQDGFIENDDPLLAEAEAEIISDEKTGYYGDLGEIIIQNPTVGVSSEIDMYYNEQLTKFLETTTLKTQKRMLQILEKRGDWTLEDDNNIDDLQERIAVMTVKIANQKNKYVSATKETQKNGLTTKILALEKERTKLMAELMQMNVLQAQLFGTTVEKRAEEEAIYYKVSVCTKRSDGSPVFKDIEDIKSRQNNNDMQRLVTDCIKFWRGINSPFSESLLSEMIGNSAIE